MRDGDKGQLVLICSPAAGADHDGFCEVEPGDGNNLVFESKVRFIFYDRVVVSWLKG